jgi:hypothetical protein
MESVKYGFLPSEGVLRDLVELIPFYLFSPPCTTSSSGFIKNFGFLECV